MVISYPEHHQRFSTKIPDLYKPTFNLPEKYAYTGAVVGVFSLGIRGYGSSGYITGTMVQGSGSSISTSKNGVGQYVGYNAGTAALAGGTGYTLGISTDPDKSGIVCEKDTQIMVCIKY